MDHVHWRVADRAAVDSHSPDSDDSNSQTRQALIELSKQLLNLAALCALGIGIIEELLVDVGHLGSHI